MDEAIEIPEDETVPTIGVSRKTLLIGLVGLAGVAVFLAVLRAAMAARVQPPAGSVADLLGDDWKVTVQHLADAFQARTDGLDERLQALEPTPEPTNYAVPLPPLRAEVDGPANAVAPTLSEEPPPPGPASVSV